MSQGQLYLHQRRYDDAEKAYERALAINERRAARTIRTARSLNDLALLSIARGESANAIAYSRKATATVLAHATLGDQAGRRRETETA